MKFEPNWKKEQYKEVFINKLTEAQAAQALNEAYKDIFGYYPKLESIALLWSQCALETGRFQKINNNNFGNIKKKHYKKLSWTEIPDDEFDFTMVATGENLPDKNTGKITWMWFEPPSEQTHFRSYPTPEEGAKDYIRLFLKERYKLAWKEVINGDPKAFSYALFDASYYTANKEKYTAGVIRLFEEFMQRHNELIPHIKEEVKEQSQFIPAEITNEKPKLIEPEVKSSNSSAGIMLVVVGIITALYTWISNLF